MYRGGFGRCALVLALAACGGAPVRSKPTYSNRRDETSKPIRTELAATVGDKGSELTIRVVERDTCLIRTVQDVALPKQKPTTEEIGKPRETPCGERAVSGKVLVLVAGEQKLDLPATNAQGASTIAWETLPPALIEDAKAPRRADIRLADRTIASVDLEAARLAVAERAWTAAEQAGTARAAAAFHARFPSVHEGDVAKRIAERADDEYDQAVGAAIDGGDFVTARKLVDEWAALVPVASDKRTAREAAISTREKDSRTTTLLADVNAALAAQGDVTDLGPLQRATAAVDELAKLAPADPRTVAAQKSLADARKARQAALFARATASDKAGQLEDALRSADVAVETLPGDAATKQRSELRKTIARRFVAQVRVKIAAKDLTAAAEAQSKAELVAADDREVVAMHHTLETQQAAAEAAIKDAAERDRKKAERLAQQEALKAQREAERQKEEADRQARADEAKRKQEEARQKLEAERAAKAEEAKRRQDEARAKAEADKAAARDKAEADKAARAVALKAKQDAELAAKADAERKRQEQKALKLAKADGAKQKPVALPATQATVSATSIVGDARTASALPGVWAAVGHVGRDRVTLLFNATGNGSGSVTMLAMSGRVLARQNLTWQIENGALAIDGGKQLALRGPAKLAADQLSWAGYDWHRVRARTTLAAQEATPDGSHEAAARDTAKDAKP